MCICACMCVYVYVHICVLKNINDSAVPTVGRGGVNPCPLLGENVTSC